MQFGSQIGAIDVRGAGHSLILDPQLNINRALRSPGLGLEVAEGNTLASIGGKIDLNGGNLTAPGGKIVLGSVNQSGKVGLTVRGREFIFDFQDIDAFENVELAQASSLDLTGEQSGSLQIYGQNINLIDNSAIIANTVGSGRGGQLDFQATETFKIAGSETTDFPSAIFTQVKSGATGDGSPIDITAIEFQLQDNAILLSSTAGSGDAGAINLQVQQADLANGGHIASENNGLGKSGKLLVNANETLISGSGNGRASGLFTSITRIENNKIADDNENPANLELENRVDLDAAAVESNFIISGAKLTVGNGGEIVSSTSGIVNAENLKIIATDVLAIEDGGKVGSFTSGNGDAGSLSIEVGNSLTIGISEFTRATFDGDLSTEITPGSLFSRVETAAQGNGGQINVTTKDLQIDYGGQISANTSGEGNAGDIILNAENITVQDSIEIDGVRTGISSGVESSGIGKGGEIEINVDRNLLISRGGSIGVDARSANIDPEIEITAGSITIEAGNIEINGALDSETAAEFAQSSLLKSRISAFSEGTSNSGDVRITADKLSIIDTAETIGDRVGISVRNNDLGSAGNIALDIGELILAGGQLNAEVNSGTRGNVSLKTNSIAITAQGGINTQASGSATSGNIIIENTGNIIIEDSEIVADATEGNAGNIQIDTVGLFRDRNSEISASSELGIDGVVALNTSFDAARNLGAAFPKKLLDPDIKSTQSCETNDDKDNFAYIGRGGLPANPFDSLAEEDFLIDWSATEAIANDLSSFDLQRASKRKYSLNERSLGQNNAGSSPMEAQSWERNSAGRIELVATTEKPALSGLYDRCHAVN